MAFEITNKGNARINVTSISFKLTPRVDDARNSTKMELFRSSRVLSTVLPNDPNAALKWHSVEFDPYESNFGGVSVGFTETSNRLFFTGDVATFPTSIILEKSMDVSLYIYSAGGDRIVRYDSNHAMLASMVPGWLVAYDTYIGMRTAYDIQNTGGIFTDDPRKPTYGSSEYGRFPLVVINYSILNDSPSLWSPPPPSAQCFTDKPTLNTPQLIPAGLVSKSTDTVIGGMAGTKGLAFEVANTGGFAIKITSLSFILVPNIKKYDNTENPSYAVMSPTKLKVQLWNSGTSLPKAVPTLNTANVANYWTKNDVSDRDFPDGTPATFSTSITLGKGQNYSFYVFSMGDTRIARYDAGTTPNQLMAPGGLIVNDGRLGVRTGYALDMATFSVAHFNEPFAGSVKSDYTSYTAGRVPAVTITYECAGASG